MFSQYLLGSLTFAGRRNQEMYLPNLFIFSNMNEVCKELRESSTVGTDYEDLVIQFRIVRMGKILS